MLEGAQPPYGFKALGGVAVIAGNTWAASEGRKKLKVEWESGPHAVFTSEAYKKTLLDTVNQPQQVVRTVGDVDAAFSSAAKIVEASYYTPLLAHAPMEPPAALADYREGKVEVWAATQNPQEVQTTVSKALGIKETDVTCHVTLLGGGFGRKSKPDYVAEAALLSKKVGKPVKISWTREEDIHFDYFHTTSAMYFKAGLDAPASRPPGCSAPHFPLSAQPSMKKNDTVGASFHSASSMCRSTFRISAPKTVLPRRISALAGCARLRIFITPSVFSLLSMSSRTPRKKIRSNTGLATLGAPRQIDLATQKAKYTNYGKPLAQYPLDTGRLKRVVEVAAEKSGWGNRKAGNGSAWGFAAHRSFLTYVAAVVQIEVDPSGKLRIPRVDMAVDCGSVHQSGSRQISI